MKYDIIGDIHGHADELVLLLAKLGYIKRPEGYNHREKKAIFLGDFIDRGPKNELALDIVMSMVNSGAALAVMGNHEYNAICYHTKRPETGEYLREHSEKNIKQHKTFLAEFEDKQQKLKHVIDWFKTLPLFIDLGFLRVVHAEWNFNAIEIAKPLLTSGHQFTETFLLNSRIEMSPEDHIVETLLKGTEVPLPEGVKLEDSDGHERDTTRIKWWSEGEKSYHGLGMIPEEQKKKVPNASLDIEVIPYPSSAPPVFFGHYWLRGPLEIQKCNVACVDYSVAKGGKLCSYSWNSEDNLSEDNFHFVPSTI